MSTIFANGRLFDEKLGSREGAVAIADGHIAAIGELDDVRAAVVGAEEFDLAGGLLSPSFTDAHLHPMMGGVERGVCNLGPAASANECVRIVADYAAAHPERPWIMGGGWRMDHFEGGRPTHELLDEVAPDRPVILISTDRHSAWVNSRTLNIAGITRESPDPSDGRIERDAAGEPTGVLHEGAMATVLRISPEPGLLENYEGLLVAQRLCFDAGITGWQDALIRIGPGGGDGLDVYEHALKQQALIAKVTAALWWDRTRGLEQIDDLIARRERASRWAPTFRANSVKIALDGIMESFTAALTEPYRDACGHDTDNSGMSFITRENLLEIVRTVDRAGFQAHFHALGDLAVRDALDALEALDSPRDLRHHLAHLQVIQPDDVPRFARSGAVANIQTLWAQKEPAMTELTLPFLSPGLQARQYPFNDLHHAGVHLAAGSDWPVSDLAPILAMHVAVNRSEPTTAQYGPLLPEQALDLTTAWKAYTSGSAWLNHREETVGSLRVGLSADLVTLDRDPFSAPREEIASAQVRTTWVDGRMVAENAS